MTSKEIRKAHSNNFRKLRYHTRKVSDSFYRKVVRCEAWNAAEIVDYDVNGVSYKSVIFVPNIGGVLSLPYIYLKDTNEYLFVPDDIFDDPALKELPLHAFSVHLLKRIAERRFHDKDMGIDEILIKSGQLESNRETPIYTTPDGSSVVFATKDGIYLSSYDKKTGIYHHKTFVSEDMLGESQRKAIKSLHLEDFDLSVHNWNMFGSNSAMEAFMLRKEMIESIDFQKVFSEYGEYFEKKGKKL